MIGTLILFNLASENTNVEKASWAVETIKSSKYEIQIDFMLHDWFSDHILQFFAKQGIIHYRQHEHLH